MTDGVRDVLEGRARWAVECADAVTFFRALPDGCVHCCVTSPPYYGTRDYGTAKWEGGDSACAHIEGYDARQQKHSGDIRNLVATEQKSVKIGRQYQGLCGQCGARRVDQQLGLEATVEEYVANLVGVFREVRRVLRPDSTLWLNLGDSFSSGLSGNRPSANSALGSGPGGNSKYRDDCPRLRRDAGLKPKDLIGAPWRVAFALQADGWTLRSDIIWHKKSPMPESVRDRPTKAHEYLFLLAKQPRYYYDAEAVRELPVRPPTPEGKSYPPGYSGNGRVVGAVNRSHMPYDPAGRNLRSVWSLSPEPFRGSHFATMPSRLVERCVRAGTSEYGVCPACRAPWRRIVERKAMIIARSERTHSFGRTRTSGTMVEPPEAKTVGWQPGCACGRPDVVPALVFDPFSGAGTVPLVALRLGRRGLGCDLNEQYVKLACRRIVADAPLFNHESGPSNEIEEERDLPCVS